MAQLHFYVPSEVEDQLRRRADAAGLTLSRYIAQIVRKEIGSGWPDGFFEEVAGGWSGPAQERGDQGTAEVRDRL
jgi:hypothetical protein